MAAISSSISPAAALLTNFAVTNFTLALANTEYTLVMPTGAKHFCLQARGMTTIKIADTAGLSGTTYFTLNPGVPYSIDSVTGTSTITLYVQSTKPGQIIEILSWT